MYVPAAASCAGPNASCLSAVAGPCWLGLYRQVRLLVAASGGLAHSPHVTRALVFNLVQSGL